MSTDSEWQDSCDDEPDIDSYQCYVSITRLTDEEIERWTNPALVNSASNNSLNTIDHNYSASSITYDSDATTVEEFDISRPEGSVKKTETDGPSSLYDDDEIISIELDRGTKKKVQIYDKCTIPDKLVTRYNGLKKRHSSTLPLFCLFCLKEYYQVNQVLSCHYQQAKHFPFRCVECEESTLDTKGMIQHYTKTHPTSTHVQYRRSFAPAKERWVRKFVIYQLKCITNQAIMIPNGILHKYCPVCNQWDYKLGDKYPKNKPKHKLSTVLDKNHIHKHLKYHPFQCLLCLKKNVRCDFTVVNKKARLHLINCHGFSAPTEQDLKDNFDSLGMIPELERYINSYVKFVQESFTRQTFRLSPIADTSSQTPKKILSTPPSSVSTKQSTPLSILSGGKKSGSSGKPSKAISKLTTGKKRRYEYSIDDMYYPSPKYARRDYSKPKNGKKSYSTDSSVIDLDSFYEDSSNPYLKPDQAPRIICIFCNYQVTDILAAWDHYATHLDYRPINCQLCHKSFPGPKAFQLHGSDHVDHDNLPYTWHHDEIIEAWSRDFLNSIVNDINANPEFACFCPICSKKFQKQKVSSQKLSYDDVRKHIFAHLRYQPYHCNLCTGDKVFVADLDHEGVRHLTFHEVICSKEELTNHFTRSRGIEAVDSFLVDHFKKIRQLFNIPSGNISAEGNVPNDPLCDVESLFNSLQETLGHNTLNNILDNVSNSEDRSCHQNELAIDYPCTPSSTTSDPVTASSPNEPDQVSLPPSPIKPIATVTNESSDTMIPSASESSTSAKSSPTQESPMDVTIIEEEKKEKTEVNSLVEPQFVDNEKLDGGEHISKGTENNQIDNVKIIVENKTTDASLKSNEIIVPDGNDEKIDANNLEEPVLVDNEKLDDEKKISEETEDSQMLVDIQDDVAKPTVENTSTDISTKPNATIVTDENEANSLKEPEFVTNEKMDDEKKILEEIEDSQMMVDAQDDVMKPTAEKKSIDTSLKSNEIIETDGNDEKNEANSLKEPEFVNNEKLNEEQNISEETKDSQMMVDIQDDVVKPAMEKKSTDISTKPNATIVTDENEANNLEPEFVTNEKMDDEKKMPKEIEDSQMMVDTQDDIIKPTAENTSTDISTEPTEIIEIDGDKANSLKEPEFVNNEKIDNGKKISEETKSSQMMVDIQDDVIKSTVDKKSIDISPKSNETIVTGGSRKKIAVTSRKEPKLLDADNLNEDENIAKVTEDYQTANSVNTVSVVIIDIQGKDESENVETKPENLHHGNEKVVIKQEKVHSDDKKPYIKSEKVDSATDTNNIKSRKLDNEKVNIKQEKIDSDHEKLNMKNSKATKRDSTGSVKAGTRKMPARKGKAVVENKSTNTPPKLPEKKEIKLRRKTIVSTGTPSSRTRSKTTKVTTATQTR